MKLTLRKPSAAMVVATTALVSSFAGPAVADEVAKIAQSITSSSQIKNGTVTGADVKNSSITTDDLLDGSVRSSDIGTGQVQTSDLAPDSIRGDKIPNGGLDGSDIRDDGLSGADIAESTLSRVGSADRAITADSANSAKSAETFAGTKPLFWSRALSVGESVELAKAGPFTFRGECNDTGGGSTQARVTVTTSAGGSFIYSSDNTTDDDFNPGETFELVEESTSSDDSYDTTELIFWDAANTTMRIDYDGEPFGVAVNTNGADCRLYGDGTVSAG